MDPRKYRNARSDRLWRGGTAPGRDPHPEGEDFSKNSWFYLQRGLDDIRYRGHSDEPATADHEVLIFIRK
jgi:hypothetical protein